MVSVISKNCTFTAFVAEEVRIALENIKDKNELLFNKSFTKEKL